MTIPTLDGLSVEQLRDLAKRAEAIAAKKVKEKAEKDVIPDADGSVWEYGGRLWTVVRVDSSKERLLYSIPKYGGAIRGWWCSSRFSTSYIPKDGGWYAKTLVEGHSTDSAIIRLALRVRDA